MCRMGVHGGAWGRTRILDEHFGKQARHEVAGGSQAWRQHAVSRVALKHARAGYFLPPCPWHFVVILTCGNTASFDTVASSCSSRGRSTRYKSV